MDRKEDIVDFTSEAKQNLKEILYAIKEGFLSPDLPCTVECAYINITTREEKKVTVRLCMRGFEVVGHSYDNRELENEENACFETVYALLNHISPSYQQTFYNAVSEKLQLMDSSPLPPHSTSTEEQ